MPALDAIRDALRGAQARGIEREALERARMSLMADFRTSASTNDGISALFADALTFERPLEAVADYPARLQAITQGDVRRVAQRYFGEEALRLVVHGDRSLQPELAQRGFGAVELRNEVGEVVTP